MNEGGKQYRTTPKSVLKNILKFTSSGSFLVAAYHQQQLVALNLFLCSPTSIFYTQNASTDLGRRLAAPSLIIYRTLLYGKKIGKKYFDFDGIYDDRNPILTSSWRGFSHFKKHFGGTDIMYLPTFEKNINGNLKIWERLLVKLFWPKLLPSIYPSPP